MSLFSSLNNFEITEDVIWLIVFKKNRVKVENEPHIIFTPANKLECMFLYSLLNS